MRKFIIISMILGMFLSFPHLSLAIGQVTQPIIISNAMRGQQIQEVLDIVNSDAKDTVVEFTSEGQIKDWVKFYHTDHQNDSIASTTIAAKTNLKILAIFTIPTDIANGEYKGLVSVTKAAENIGLKNESISSIAQKIDRSVSIKVSDKEDIKLVVSVIPKTYDLAPNESLKVRIIYDNQSNISLKPAVSFKIIANDKAIYNVIYPYPEGTSEVRSKAMYEIPALEIPTTNIGNGEYLAKLEFLRGDQSIAENHFGFTIKNQNATLGSGGAFSTFVAKIINFAKNHIYAILWVLLLILLGAVGILVKKRYSATKA